MTTLRRYWPPLLFALYGAAYLAWLFTTSASESARSLAANLGYLPIGALSIIITLRITRVAGLPARQRHAWQLVAAACALTTVSDIVRTIDENVLGRDPSGGWSTVGYLLYYPVLLGGLLLFPQALRSRREAGKFLLDVGTVMVGGSMAVWHFVIVPMIAAPSPDRLGALAALCYPLGDLLVLFGIATVLLRCPRGARRHSLLLLAASLAAAMVADLVWARLALDGEFQAGNIQDVPYMVQYVLFAAAVSVERRRLGERAADDDNPQPRPFMSLSYLSIVSGYTLMLMVVWERNADDMLSILLSGVSLTALVVVRQIVAVRDAARLERERTLLASDARFKSLIQRSTDVVSILDGDGTIAFVTPSVTATLGYSTAQLLGRTFLDFVHPDDAQDATGRIQEALLDPARVMTARWRIRRSDDTWVHTDNVCTNLVADDTVRGLVLNTRDISDRASFEAQLVHQAFHDPLTGLANRALFQDRVHHALAKRRAGFDVTAVLFIDLDRFKIVNDNLGHASGDTILKGAARRILACLRVFDTTARLSGDEFAVLIEDTPDRDHVLQVAERIARAFHEPFVVDGREARVTASVGVAVAVAGQTSEELLRNADLAMYVAKSRGRGQAAVFEPAMHAAVANRLELQSDLRYALERNELSLCYQPIHVLETQALVGAEALLRWNHPTRGSIPPAVFVPIAEDTGLIVPIGRWVLSRACLDAGAWKANLACAPLRVSVNLSNRQVPEPTLFDDVQDALRASGLAPATLVLELAESILLQNTDQTLSVMNRLRSQGVRLAIDNFGTGYSSLSHLQRLPIDTLKIDRGFIGRMSDDDTAVSLARGIIALGQSMSLSTVAEGIESVQQAEQLRSLGCDFGQGFFYGAPMCAQDLETYARRRHALTAA